MSDFVGATLGDYRLEALLGTGRLGQVFRASHVRFESVFVAIRVFDANLVDARGFKARFFEYAQAAGNIVHPHVVRVRESGEDDRRWFVAMDLMPGATLATLRPDPATAEWASPMWGAVDCICQAAEGIAAGYKLGLSHGNAHLGNLFLVDPVAGIPQVKVADAGLADFAPLEGQPASQARDVFTLGEGLYALTTGRDAFPREAVAAVGLAHDGAVVASPRRLLRGYPESLETIIVRCLAADPRDRFESCAALAAALRQALQTTGYTGQAITKAPAGAVPAVVELTIAQQMAKQPPPRPAPTIKPGAQAVPCVHVLDASGNRVDMEYLQSTGLKVGRAESNDIVLKVAAVSQEHARIDWADNRITVTDLGSTNNTLMRGHKLLPQVSQEWDSEQWLQIGPYWLWLEVPTGYTDLKDRIEVIVDQRGRSMTITPGKPATCRVMLSNQRTTIQQVELSIEGIPAAWVEGTSVRRHLPPLEQREMELVINVPRSPEGLAKTYAVTIRVHSFTDPTADQGSGVATWTVEPFESSRLLLTPSKAAGVRQANYSVTVWNEGNRPLSYALTGVDNDRRLECVFSAEGYPSSARLAIDVPPGERTNVRMQVVSPRRWFGSTTPHSFTVQAATTEGHHESKAEGHFQHRAVFPIWAMALVPVVLIGILFLIPWLMRPQVRTVYVDPINPKPDTSFSIFWDAPGANRIRVLVNELPVRPDPDAKDGTYVFTGGFKKDTRVKVIGSNMFGEVAKEVTVTLAPPDPVLPPVLEASIDAQEVAPGQDVTISWSARQADRVEFSHRGSVGLSGTFTDHPTQPQTYVISAFNSAGTEVKKTFQVQVRRGNVPPGQVRLSASSKDRKKDKANFEITQGRYVFFDWDAPNAVKVRMEGGGTPVELAGTTGRARRAQLRGKGHYTFRLIATSETGDEVISQPIEIDVVCTGIQIATKRCKGAPEVRW